MKIHKEIDATKRGCREGRQVEKGGMWRGCKGKADGASFMPEHASIFTFYKRYEKADTAREIHTKDMQVVRVEGWKEGKG